MLNGLEKPLSRHGRLSWLLALLLGLPGISQAGATAKSKRASSASPKSTASVSPSAESPAILLDHEHIHAIYTEGDFEGVVAAIDSFTLANKTYSHSDSIFIAKHLAVVYTANPATREKGKNYMFRLLDLMPSAKIVDMFVSDEIDRIFERVREEFIIRQQAYGKDKPTNIASHRYASDRMTVKDAPLGKTPARKEEKSSSNAKYWFVGGITVAAVAGASIYFLQPKKAADKNYDLP